MEPRLQANSDPCKCSFWGFTALQPRCEFEGARGGWGGGFRVGFRVEGSGLKVQGSGLPFQSSGKGFRVQGLRFRVL